MAKATSSFMARKKSQLAKYKKLDAAAYGAKELLNERAVKDLEAKLSENAEAFKAFGVFRDLPSYSAKVVTEARAVTELLNEISEGGAVNEIDIHKLLINELPDVLMDGDRYVEQITSIRGITIDATKFWNHVHVKFAGRISKLTRVLVIGLDTDMPGEIYGYEGLPPTDPESGLDPNTTAIYYKIPGVRFRRESDFRATTLNMLEAQFEALQRMFNWVCRSQVEKFKLKEAAAAEMDLTEILTGAQSRADNVRDFNSMRGDWAPRQSMKGTGTHFHESHHISSNTTEASAEAIANVALEYMFGRVYLSEPVDGYRELLMDKLGLADELYEIEDDEELRKIVRLIAFLHRYDSMKHISVAYGPTGVRLEKVTPMTAKEIAEEWRPEHYDRHIAVYKELGVMKDGLFRELDPEPDDDYASRTKLRREKVQDYMHQTNLLADGWSMAERSRSTRTEFVSHDAQITPHRVAKALNIYYKTLQAIKQQILDDDSLDHEYIPVQHPESSGCSLIREVVEWRRGVPYSMKRPMSVSQGCYIRPQIQDYMSKYLDRTEILPAFRDNTFVPVEGEPGVHFEVHKDFNMKSDQNPDGRPWDRDWQYAIFPVTVTYTDPLFEPETEEPVIKLEPREVVDDDLDPAQRMILDLLYEVEKAEEERQAALSESDDEDIY